MAPGDKANDKIASVKAAYDMGFDFVYAQHQGNADSLTTAVVDALFEAIEWGP